MAEAKAHHVIAGGRLVLETHHDLRASWHGFLHHLDQLDATDRRRFIAYVRLVYGTTGSITLPIDGPPHMMRLQEDLRLSVADDLRAAEADVRDLRAKVAALADEWAAWCDDDWSDQTVYRTHAEVLRELVASVGRTEPETGEGGVETGASGENDPARQGREATFWVNRSVDNPEAPAQVHTSLAVGRTEPEVHAGSVLCRPFTRYSGTAGSKVDAALGGDEGGD